MFDNEIILGIDLGTSNSAAAVYDGLMDTIIPAKEGASPYGKSFPSCVAFADDGRILIGEPAKNYGKLHPENTVFKVKRLMGTNEKVKVNNQFYTPEEISAFVLQKIKKDAENFLEKTIKKAVISVPAYFNRNQRQATADAAKLAGLEPMFIINEPNAAAIAYGFDRFNFDDNFNILFFDFGGGTLDIAIISAKNGKFEIISSVGDNELGGTNMDEDIVNYLVDEFERTDGINLRDDKKAFARVEKEAEEAKIKLSNIYSYNIDLPFITKDKNGVPKNLNITLTRNKLEELVGPTIKKTEKTIRKALSDANMTKDDIDKIILVGGPTRMPLVKDFVSKVLGKPIEGGVDPMECVAIGAAVYGWNINDEASSPFVIDVHRDDGEDNMLDLEGLAKVPYSIGIEADKGLNSKIIKKYQTLPAEGEKEYETAEEGQTKVTVKILQGEEEYSKDAVKLGEIKLDNIKGDGQVKIRFSITVKMDYSGLIEVIVKNKESGEEYSDVFEFSKDTSDNSFQKSQKKLIANDENNKIRENADKLIFEANSIKSNHGDRISSFDIYSLDEEISELERAISEFDKDKIEERIVELAKRINEIKEENNLD